VLPADCYYTIRLLAANWLSAIGVTVRLAPTRDNAQAAVLDGARVLWIETPTNPQLDVCDIRHLTSLASQKGIVTVVDNTTATPYCSALSHSARRTSSAPTRSR
jgi:cystathionine gamma-lyase